MRYLLILSFLFLSLAVEGSALISPKKHFEVQKKAKYSIIPKQKTAKPKFKKVQSIKLIHFLKNISKDKKSKESHYWLLLILSIISTGLGVYIMIAINTLLYLGLLLVIGGVFLFLLYVFFIALSFHR